MTDNFFYKLNVKFTEVLFQNSLKLMSFFTLFYIAFKSYIIIELINDIIFRPITTLYQSDLLYWTISITDCSITILLHLTA